MEFGSNYHFNLNIGDGIDFKKKLKSHYYFFASGRMAISFIIERLNLKTIYIPNYLCEQVYKCFDRLTKKFYTLTDKLEYDCGLERIEEGSIIFLSNYFGLSDESNILKLLKEEKKKKKNIIVVYDITHSLFSINNSDIVDYYIASFRKWFSIPDGAFINCDKIFKLNYERISDELVKEFIYASILKLLYIKSQNKIVEINEKYRNLFIDSENKLSKINGYFNISLFSEIYINNINSDVLERRKDNFNFLKNEIKNDKIKLIFNQVEGDKIPFLMPIKCKERDKLKKYLMEHQVYCAIHWDQKFMSDKVKKLEISEQILSIPIDDRYTISDMKLLVKIINNFGE